MPHATGLDARQSLPNVPMPIVAENRPKRNPSVGESLSLRPQRWPQEVEVGAGAEPALELRCSSSAARSANAIAIRSNTTANHR